MRMRKNISCMKKYDKQRNRLIFNENGRRRMIEGMTVARQRLDCAQEKEMNMVENSQEKALIVLTSNSDFYLR